jgi:hypothetical protein
MTKRGLLKAELAIRDRLECYTIFPQVLMCQVQSRKESFWTRSLFAAVSNSFRLQALAMTDFRS